jgi:NAD(P)-dependent dehydrogenase (short-subunit alcohol dehydrogenase family)
MLKDLLSYAGKRVLVTGGGGAGMGAATVQELFELDVAEVHVLDLKKPTNDSVTAFHEVDLRDPAAIDAALDAVGQPIHALFNCAGVAGAPFSGLDTTTINFLAARHLANRMASGTMPAGGAIATISSGAGVGWMQAVEPLMEFVRTPTFEEGRAWCDAHPEFVADGYRFSKMAVNVWTMSAAVALAQQGIRLNCTSPGITETPLLPQFVENLGEEAFRNLPRPIGRDSTREEQAQALVFLNSDAASYIAGANLATDGGFQGGILTGQLEMLRR